MEEIIEEKSNYFRNTLIFIVLSLVSLFIADRFFLKSIDMKLLKEQRIENLLNLPEGQSIKVGIVWPFFLEEGDNYFKEGILFAVDELNRKKLLGRKIEVVFRDDKWELEEAKKIANEFANDKDIVAVIAHDDVDLAVPVSITYEYSGIVMISPAVSSPVFTKVNFDYIFRNTPSDTIIGQELAIMAKASNFKKIAVLSARDTYSESLAEVFSGKVLEDDLEIIYNMKFNEGEKDFLKILNDLSPLSNYSIDYDAIFVAGDEEDVPLLISKARKKGIYATFITGDLLDSPELLKIKDAANGTIIATIYNSELISEKLQDLKSEFKKIYKVLPDTWAIQGYDAMMLLAQAIENSQSLDTSLIASQLKYMSNFNSITGKYSLTPKGDTIDKGVYFKIVKNQKFQYLNVE
jgi:branched-chain amino acid transport system substrate-binding protein